MYYSSGNYEAFARPQKPEGVDHKSAYFIGTGLAALSAGCFLVRSTLTEMISLESVSYSSHAPLLGIMVVAKSLLLDLSTLTS